MYNERQKLNTEAAFQKGLTGENVGIAFLDTGVSPVNDLIKPKNRIIGFVDFILNKKKAYDDNGHGTHVVGIASGNGFMSNGKYMGIAPKSNIISVKVLDKNGEGNSAIFLAGLQWIYNNAKRYNIRIVNLSVGSPHITRDDLVVKAVEFLWDSGLVVVAAAGNNGPKSGTITSPGISKKIITVGASDDNNEAKIWGSNLVHFSGRGPTLECVIKPDLLAPGFNIISLLGLNLQRDNVVDKNYLMLSGTSMATPMVSGAIALLLEKYPSLDSNQVKKIIKNSCNSLGFPKNHEGFGLLDISKLINFGGYIWV
ncbi:MAG: S8 family peptidase [Defluviitaleaceae bacterium]|nr:S8 family peptidase [Defluviitaleaceae bacterium]